MSKIIAIHGKKRSGKGTIAKYLTSEYGYKHVVISRPLKDMTNILLNTMINFDKTNANPFDFTDGDLKEKPLLALNGRNTRDIMIWLGAQFAMAIEPNLWIDITMNEINEHISNGDNVYVDNLRLYPEFHVMKETGAELWAVVSSHHYNELPTEGNFTVVENAVKPCDVIDDSHCGLMVKYVFERLGNPETINGKNQTECSKILKKILRDGLSGHYDNQPPLTEKGLDLNEFPVIIYNDGTIKELEDKVDALLNDADKRK